MNCMGKNIFKGAKFGDKFKCRNGKLAVYLKDLGGKEYHHLLYLEDDGDTTFADDGRYYYDKEDALDVIGRFEKPVDEEKIKEMAEVKFSDCSFYSYEESYVGGFLDGYRQASNGLDG